MTFAEFVVQELAPLAGLRPVFGMQSGPAIKALGAELVKLCGTDADKPMPSIASWKLTEIGCKVEIVCEELAACEELPTLPDLRTIWHGLFAEKGSRIAAPSCPHCLGAGWEVRKVTVDGEEREGALRCRCGGCAPPVRAV